MKFFATLDQAGGITIPEQMLAELNLAPGDTLTLENTSEEISLLPVYASSPLAQEHGVWVLHSGEPLPASLTREVLAQSREERDLKNFRKEKLPGCWDWYLSSRPDSLALGVSVF